MKSNEKKSIIIIGAGIAGLAAGCYAQMNGFKTTILEAHTLPGGVCTAWKRKGYTFDGCIHWLVGSSPQNSYYRMWEELGAVQNRQFYNGEDLYTVLDAEGRCFRMTCDPDRLQEQMDALSPVDKEHTREFTDAIRRFSKVNIPVEKAAELMSPIDGIKMLLGIMPSLGDFRRFGKVSIQEFAEKFQDPFLRKGLLCFFDMPDFPVMAVIATLAWMNKKSAGFPLGGSLAFSEAIAERYHQLGGEIRYNQKVDKILVDQGCAIGVQLANGMEYSADIIISAADGFSTIYRMLDGQYTNDAINQAYNQRQIFHPLIQVSLGVNRGLEEEPKTLIYSLKNPITIEGKPHAEIGVKNYSFDRCLAPEHKTALVIQLKADYDYWKTLAEDADRYHEEKQQVLEQVVNGLEERYPGIRQDIEVADVATPLTYERYTHNWRGSFEGWFLTTQNFGKTYPYQLPDLANCYMVGQWVQPGGGVPTVAKCGRDIVQILCKREKRRFTSSLPVSQTVAKLG